MGVSTISEIQGAALDLMRFMSDFREAMWGVVQAAVSKLELDCEAYAAEHFDRLERTATHTHCPYKGDASYWSVRVGDRVVADAAWSYEDPLPVREDIRGYLCFYPSRVDAFLVDGQPLARG